MFMWIPHTYTIKFDFVNLSHVNLILGPARRTFKGKGKLSQQCHSHYAEKKTLAKFLFKYKNTK